MGWWRFLGGRRKGDYPAEDARGEEGFYGGGRRGGGGFWVEEAGEEG